MSDLFDDDLGIDDEAVIAEELDAARRRRVVEAGRRRAGAAGAAMAGIMLVISDIYVGPQKDDVAIVSEASGEPGDIDEEGISLNIDGIAVWTPPPGDPS